MQMLHRPQSTNRRRIKNSETGLSDHKRKSDYNEQLIKSLCADKTLYCLRFSANGFYTLNSRRQTNNWFEDHRWPSGATEVPKGIRLAVNGSSHAQVGTMTQYKDLFAQQSLRRPFRAELFGPHPADLKKLIHIVSFGPFPNAWGKQRFSPSCGGDHSMVHKCH